MQSLHELLLDVKAPPSHGECHSPNYALTATRVNSVEVAVASLDLAEPVFLGEGQRHLIEVKHAKRLVLFSRLRLCKLLLGQANGQPFPYKYSPMVPLQ